MVRMGCKKPCNCPPGPKGDKGDRGIPGVPGQPGNNETCCFPPARTIVVSNPVPVEADPALWFDNIQDAIDQAQTLFSPTATNRALVLVAYQVGAYGNVVMRPNVDVKTFAMDQVVTGAGTAPNEAPLQAIGNLTFAPIGGVDEFVRLDGFQVDGALSVDFTGKGAGIGKFFGNGRVIGATSAIGRADDIFEWEGALSLASNVTFEGTTPFFSVLVPDVTLGPTVVRASVLMDFTHGFAASGLTLEGSATLPGPNLIADWADMASGLTTTGTDEAAVIDVRAHNAKGNIALSSDDLGIHNLDAPHFEIAGSLVLRDGARVNIINASESGVGASATVDLFGDASVDMRGLKIGGNVRSNGAVPGPIATSDLLAEDVACEELSNFGTGTHYAEHVTCRDIIENTSTGSIIAPHCVVGTLGAVGTVANSGSGVLTMDDGTCNGDVSNTAAGTLNARGATIGGNLTNIDGIIEAQGANVVGEVQNTGDGTISWRNGTAASAVNTDTDGVLDARESRVLTADNEMGAAATGAILRRQTGITGPITTSPQTIPINGSPYTAGGAYRVLITQTVGAPVAAVIDNQQVDEFDLTVAAPANQVFAYEIVPV